MKRFVAVVAAGLIAAAALLWLTRTNDYFEQFNSNAYDFTLRLAGPLVPASPTVIVAIDEESVSRIGAWPWSRDKLAQLLDQIEKGSPAVVALDLLLNDGLTEDGDTELAEAIGRAKSIVLAAYIDAAPGRDRWLKPQAQFIKPTVRLGNVHADPDLDGNMRRIYTAKVAEGTVLPAFAVAALRGAGIPVDPRFEQEVGSGTTLLRPQAINIRFMGTGAFPQVSALDVREGRIPPETFRGRIVLIGSTVEGLGDQWFTPFSESGRLTTGVEIHANAIETFYAHRWIVEVPAVIIFFMLAAMTVFLCWIDRRYEGGRFYAMALLLGPVVMGISWALMKYGNTWLAFPPFLLTIALVVPALEIGKVVRMNRDLDGKLNKLSGVLQSFENQSPPNEASRKRLMAAPWRSSKWRLAAIDFFNEELLKFLSFNRAILSSVEDVIIVSDLRGQVVFQNPAASRLSNYREDAPPAPEYFGELLDGRSFAPVFADVFSRQKPVTMQFVPAHCGKRVFNVTIVPLANAGLILSLHDATAQHELSLAKNEMVSLVSHELRTPLTSIRGYSDMLLKYGLVQEKGKPFLGTIIDESQRLNSLIQSFLDIAYIESGRQKVSKTDFEIAPLLRDMLSTFEPVAAEKNITLEAALDGVTLVRADRLLLYQALSNLITNAIKYSAAGTTVRIAVANGDHSICLHVADQGYGIPVEEKTRVFEKFYRIGDSETRKQSGFGLGLAFVKEVAVRHGGEVTVDSEVGRGSTFTLRIPL